MDRRRFMSRSANQALHMIVGYACTHACDAMHACSMCFPILNARFPIELTISNSRFRIGCDPLLMARASRYPKKAVQRFTEIDRCRIEKSASLLHTIDELVDFRLGSSDPFLGRFRRVRPESPGILALAPHYFNFAYKVSGRLR